MRISREEFFAAADKQGVGLDQAQALWASLELNKSQNQFSFSTWIFYFGALVILSGMAWFLSFNWGWLGGGGLFFIGAAYGLLFAILGAVLWKKPGLKTPAGLLITLAVCMVPLAIYGIESYFGLWPAEKLSPSRWIVMEAGTIVAGLIALKWFSFPFLMAPIYFSAWLLAIDAIPSLLGSEEAWQLQRWITAGAGLIMLIAAYLSDRKKQNDYAFWGYLFGTLAFWGGLTSVFWDKGELVLLLYLLINILMMAASILVKRKVLMVFGAIGSFIYFTHLADEIFKDSPLFPFAVSIIGLLIMYLGIVVSKKKTWP